MEFYWFVFFRLARRVILGYFYVEAKSFEVHFEIWIGGNHLAGRSKGTF
jgi:hypothetical protein